jgi:glycosyltransferase involved in cell wall biosynthesis
MKVLMIINSLEIGGAETSLETLSSALKNEMHVEVISLAGSGYLANRLQNRGILVHQLDLRANLSLLKQCFKLFRLVRDIKPDLVHTWMYHSNFLGGVIAKLAGVKKIVWSVHAFNLERGMLKSSTRVLIKFSALFSYFIPNQIICCSQKSLEIHKQLLYKKTKLAFIPNGVDPSLFYFSELGRENIREELDLDDKTILVGCIGRFDVQKNQLGFLKTITLIQNLGMEYHFVFVGRGNDHQNHEIQQIINTSKIGENITLLGERDDISNILSALDIFAMPSKGEAFPVSLCEAMACEVPCVATNVGDVQFILGDISQTIDISKFEMFSHAIIELGSMTPKLRKQLGEKLKKRVLDNFSIAIVAQSHVELYEAI